MTSFVGDHGLLAVFILMFVAAVLPAASELTMVYGGALASGALAGHISHFRPGFHAYLAVVVVGVAGNTLGAAFGWTIGHYGEGLIERWGRWLHITPARMARAERWFDRFDDWAVPIGLATPLARSFVAIPAGIVRVPFRKFVALALVGSAAFCFGLGAAGWALGSAYTHAHRDLAYVEYAVVAGIVALAAYLLYRWGTVSRRRVADTAD